MDQELINGLNTALDCMASLPPPIPEATYNTAFNACKDQLCSALNLLIDHIKTLYDADYQVVFYEDEPNANPAPTYGFDAQQYAVHKLNYEQIDAIAKEPYTVPWKSVKSGDISTIKAKRKTEGSISEILFQAIGTPQNVEVPSTAGDVRTVTTSHFGSDGSIKEVFAIQPVAANNAGHTHDADAHIHIAGKLNVVSYVEESVKLKIIPVDNVSLPLVTEMQTKLDNIYKQAVTKVELGGGYIEGFTMGLNAPLEDLSSGWLSAYNSPMANVINEFEDYADDINYDIDDDTYYIFVLPVNCGTTDKRGYMPKKRNFGFVYNTAVTAGTEDLIKTIAHELGHGAFVLEHTFETYKNNPEQTNQATGEHIPGDNLMDYGATGTVLRKYQWDLIHDPASNFTLFDGDEEGESIVVGNIDKYLKDFKNTIDNTYTFLSPGGKPFSIKADYLEKVEFNTGDEITKGNTCEGFEVYLFGSLRSFEVKIDDTYTKYYTCRGCSGANTSFNGYVTDIINSTDCGTPYVDDKEIAYNEATDKVIIGFPFFEDDKLIFQIGQINLSNPLVDKSNIPSNPSEGNYLANASMVDFDLFIPDYDNILSSDVPDFPPFVEQEPGEEKVSEMPITPQNMTGWSPQVREFLDKLSFATKRNHASGPIIFTHAQQIGKYPALFSRCGFDNPEIDLLKNMESYEQVEARLEDMCNVTGIDCTNQTGDFFVKGVIDEWKGVDKSIYKSFQENYGALNIEAFIDALPNAELCSIEEAEEIYDYFKIFNKDFCAYYGISIDRRLKLIDILKNAALNSADLGFLGEIIFSMAMGPYVTDGDDHMPPELQRSYEAAKRADLQESIINTLIGTTPGSDYVTLLNYFFGANYNDPTNFYQLADKLNDSSFANHNDPPYDAFVSRLADIYMSIHTGPQSYNIDEGTHQINFNGGTPMYYHEIGKNGDPDGDGEDIYYTYQSEILWSPGNATPLKITSSRKHQQPYFYVEYPTTTKPTDWVGIQFKTEYNKSIPGFANGIEAGVIGVYPAFFAELLFRRFNQASFDYSVRVTADVIGLGLGIVTLPASGTLALVIGISDIAITGADLMIFAPEQYTLEVTGNSYITAEGQELWMKANLVYVGALFTGFVTRAAGKFTINWAKQGSFVRWIKQNSTQNKIQRLMLVREETVKFLDEVNNYTSSPTQTGKLREGFKALIASIDLEISAATTELVIMHSKNLDTRIGFAYAANVPHLQAPTYTIGQSIPVDGVNYLKVDPNFTVDLEVANINVQNGSWASVERFEDIPIMDGTTKRAGTVEIYNNGATSGNPFRFVVNFADGAIDPKLIQWKSVIIDNVGETFWNTHFMTVTNNPFRDWLIGLDANKRAAIRNFVSTWDVATIERFVAIGTNELDMFAINVQNAKAFGYLSKANAADFGNPVYWNAMANDFLTYPALESRLIANAENAKHWQKLTRSFTSTSFTQAEKNTTEFIKEMWLLEDNIVFEVSGGTTKVKYFNPNVDTSVDDIIFEVNNSTGHRVIDSNPSTAASTDIAATSKSGKNALNCPGGDCGFGDNCFPAGTIVHTPLGLKNIEDIKEGDYVVAYDTESKDTVHSRVLMPIHNLGEAMCRIITGVDTIVSTNSHKFYLPNYKKYLSADSLKAGMRILTLAGTMAVINSVAAFEAPQEVYNFEVEEHHNYFVGEEGYLVHNDTWYCFFNYVGIHDQSMLVDFPSVLREALKDDIINNIAFRDWLKASENAEVILQRKLNAWLALSQKTTLRINISALDVFTDYLVRYPNNIDEITEFLTNATTINWPGGSPFTYTVESAIGDVNSVNLHAQFSDLYFEELVAVHHNTRGPYFPLNRALRLETPMTPFLTIFETLIKRGLLKLDPFIGTTYRGTSIPEAVLFSKYENAKISGTPITELDFTSSSSVTDYLSTYMNRTINPGEVRVVMHIESVNGRYIDPISKWGVNFQANPVNQHREVIYTSGTQFYVTEFLPMTSPEGNLYYFIRMVELP